MGFSTLIDILGSTIVGGLLLVILLRLNDASMQNTYYNSGELIAQQNMVQVVKVIEYDFRKIGYCKDEDRKPFPSSTILYAASDSISFETDIAPDKDHPYGDGIVDTLTYYLGSADQLSGTPNPNDRLLYRVINNETPRGSNLGVTYFHIKYFDVFGDSLVTPMAQPNAGAISSMEISIRVENVQSNNEKYVANGESNPYYTSVFWRQIRLVARNLDNR